MGGFQSSLTSLPCSMSTSMHLTIQHGSSLRSWYVRAPTTKEMLDTLERVKACFECVQTPSLHLVHSSGKNTSRAAASATGCIVKVTVGSIGNELAQNPVLGMSFIF